MLTQNDTQTVYKTARDELLKIVRSYSATNDQIKTAKDTAEKLARDFSGKEFDTFDELTESYQDFISYMKNAISNLEKGGPIEVVTQLTDALRAIEPAISDDSSSDS
jgi:hypothetical protein